MTGSTKEMATGFVSEDTVEQYISFIAETGHSRATVAIYRAALRRFYKYLPEEKQITADTLPGWKGHLLNSGCTSKTAAAYQRIIRGFFRYIGCPGEWTEYEKVGPEPVMLNDGPDLNRAEYLLLLRTAREIGREKAYLVIKTMCLTGIKSTELFQLTVFMLQNGGGWFSQQRNTRFVQIPPLLCAELLKYADRQGIKEGAVFTTKEGAPFHHVLVWKQIKLVCRQTGLPERKGRPSLLGQLYRNTKIKLQSVAASDAEQLYQELLEREERVIGWNAWDSQQGQTPELTASIF